jgi:putative flippase GtrA
MTRQTWLGIWRFLKYSLVGVGTFLIDLSILFLATNYIGIPYYIATACSFLIAISINYSISRPFVFKQAKRAWRSGYFYFAGIGIGGALVTTGLVVVLVQYFNLYYIFARILVAGIVGIGNYLIHLYLNLRVANDHS